jgi:hypothetical protein
MRKYDENDWWSCLWSAYWKTDAFEMMNQKQNETKASAEVCGDFLSAWVVSNREGNLVRTHDS